jgi:molybdopterin-guanine dinucleotide biosynthesis protein A
MGTRFVPLKGLLPYRGATLIEAIVDRLSPLFDGFLLAVNDEEPYRALRYPMVKDRYPSLGPLGAIYSGLAEAGGTSFICGCDMPFVSRSLVEEMRDCIEGHDVVIPSFKGNLEPLHAFYGPACIPHMARQIARGDLRIVSFFEFVKVKYVNVGDRHIEMNSRLFFNINTEEDYLQALELADMEEHGDLI